MTLSEFQTALRAFDLSPEDIAKRVGTDPLTVERWLSGEAAPADVARQTVIDTVRSGK